MEDNIDYTAQNYSDIYDLLIEQMENEYADFATFEDEFNTAFDGNGGSASDWIFAEMTNRGTAASLYLPDVIGTSSTLVNDVVLGLGGAAASDIAKLLSTTNLATVVDDFGAAAVGSGSPLLAQAQAALDDFARFASKNALGIGIGFVGSKALVEGLGYGNYSEAVRDVFAFGVGHQAAALGQSMMSGYAAALADGFIGPVSGGALTFYGSKFAQAGGGLLLAGATVYAFSQAWELAEELHSGEFVSDYGWFLGKVQEYAEGYIDDVFDGEIDPQDIGDALAPFLDLWNDVLPLVNELPDWIPGVTVPFGQSENTTSPLVLDLDGDGIELTTLSAGAVYWDIDVDGFAEASAWVTGGDGLLVVDLNEDGIINDHSELFGDQTGSPNGFAALAAYDSNSDTYITSTDTDWDKLLVWVDANEDGQSQATELHTLDDLLITSINLNYSTVSYTISGNEIKQESSFVINGNTRDIVDAWFAYDNVNSIFTGDYELDPRVLFLPTLRGYGTLPDLHIAMSQNEDLLDIVSEVAAASFEDILDPTFDVEGKIRAIMYEWAGVTDIAANSRGAYIQDARTLEFLEELLGHEFKGTGANPGPDQAFFIEEAFSAAFGAIHGRITAQTALSSLLVGGEYNVTPDTFDEFSGLDPDVLTYIESLAGVSSDPSYLWRQVSTMVENTGAFEQLPSGDYVSIVEAIVASGTDTYGTSGNNTLDGSAFNDALHGDAGNDTLHGNGGSDTLVGGVGQDNLIGGAGNDVYLFDLADSAVSGSLYDRISESVDEGTDTLLFGEGIAAEDVRLWTVTGNHLFIQYSGSDLIRVNGSGYTGPSTIGERLERIVFDDATVWDLTNGLYLHNDDTGRDLYGSDYDDTIIGGAGNDYTIYGYDGSDVLVGGGGADNLRGGAGDDTYVFNIGDAPLVGALYDQVREDVGEGADTIQFGEGIEAENVRLWTITGNHLFIQYSETDFIRVYGSGVTGASTIGERLERIEFADETVWDLTNGLYLHNNDTGRTLYGSNYGDTIVGGAGNDTLNGYDGNDTLVGGSGNDTLNGDDGDDTLDGGIGNDTLKGGTGDDLFIFGSGLDTVIDTGGNDTLWITGGVTVNDISFSNVSTYHAKITVNASVDEVTVNNLRHGTASNHVETILFDDGFSANLPSYQSWMIGTSGNDTTAGNGNANVIVGNAGDDTIDAGAGDDNVHGGSGNDTIEGGDGADLLHGGIGDDILYGDDGLDILFGGDGADTFVFEVASAFNNVDEIKDFNTGQGDALNIADLLSGYDEMTDPITDFVEITTSGSNSILKVDADGGANNFVQIATLYGVTGLTDEEALETNGNLIAV